MKVAILADFTSNNDLTESARAILEIVSPVLNVIGICSKAPTQGALEGVDTVIQFLPADQFIHIPKVRNIGVSYDNSVYNQIVDETWDDVPLIPVRQLRESEIDKIHIPQADGEYVFYTVGNNVDHVLTAFSLEFDPAEPVSLVVKSDRVIDNEIMHVRSVLNLYSNPNNYKKPIVISSKFNNMQRMELHNTYHCFVESAPNRYENMYARWLNKPIIDVSRMRVAYNNRVTIGPTPYRITEQDIIKYFFDRLLNETGHF